MKYTSLKLIGLAVIPLLFTMTSTPASAQKKSSTQIKPGDGREPIEGTVVEKIDASNYTYLRLKQTAPNEDIWVAVPQINIKIGAKASLSKPIPMFGYQSKTLKRKFDRIYFGVLAEQAKEIAESSGRGHWLPGVSKNKSATPVGTNNPLHPTAGDQKIVFDINKIKVKKAEGTNSVTVSELFAKKENLKAKTIVVRGKIVKYNADILGKNWLHIADGTGSMKDKNNDITVITDGKAKLGDIVLVTGKVVVDKKLDPYFFPVAIEDAQIKVQ